MASIVAFTAARCGRAIVMPNLRPPVVTVEQAMAYRQRILDALGSSTDFQPLMTLYLTDETPVSEIEAAIDNPHIAGVKLYPAGATTNSDSGVTDLSHCADALAAMEKVTATILTQAKDAEKLAELQNIQNQLAASSSDPAVEVE